MKVFWFFFSKKNRFRAGLVGRPRAEERKRFFLKKEAKTSGRFQAKAVSHRRNRARRVPDRMRYAPQGEIGA
jgi:hypothetical protein